MTIYAKRAAVVIVCIIGLAIVIIIVGSRPAPDIFEAARAGQLSRVRALYEKNHGVVNDRNPYGATPLHAAVMGGHYAVVEWLLENGAAVDSSNMSGQTPLHAAAWQGQAAIAELLLREGANANCQAASKTTALHTAAALGRIDIVRILLKWGASPSLLDDDGETPADRARRKGFSDLASLLSR